MLRLYTFNISHFAEKARWALDYEGIDYQEKVLLPGPHQLVTRRIAKRTHVPVLQHDDRYVQGSSAILDYLAERLGGTRLALRDEASVVRVRELEASIDQAFGLGVQRVLYSEFLKHRSAVTEMWSFGGPVWARGFYAVAYPMVAAVVQRIYKTTDVAAVQRARDRFLTTFDVLDPLLAQAPYLGGEHPGRLDITVAALLAPVCRPSEHLMPWPALPTELQAFEASLKGRPTWNHVLRMYREHRKPRVS